MSAAGVISLNWRRDGHASSDDSSVGLVPNALVFTNIASTPEQPATLKLSLVATWMNGWLFVEVERILLCSESRPLSESVLS
jgi:hypothetical protein